MFVNGSNSNPRVVIYLVYKAQNNPSNSLCCVGIKPSELFQITNVPGTYTFIYILI